MKFPVQQDLHCHTHLSSCSGDPEMTVQRLLALAKEQGLREQCITDHLWDSAVPGGSPWYQPQDIAHVEENLPLPESGDVRLWFGCETEYLGHGHLGLSAANFDRFDFIVIPPNHFHMAGFTRALEIQGEEQLAELFTERLEEISLLSLPWKKIGIAHLSCALTNREGNAAAVFLKMERERLLPVFRRFAENGAGIELNASCFTGDWKENLEGNLHLYRIARDAGCKFYSASDAHHVAEKRLLVPCVREAADLLELTEQELFTLE